MTSTVCPPRDELRDYLIGALSAADGDGVADHVKACPECQSELATIDDRDDTLLDQIRMPAPEDDFSREAGCRLAMVRALSAAAAAVGEEPHSQGLPPESQLGEYRVLEEVGRGGMGTVYRALHTKLDREVAIKLLPRSHWEDERSLARFEQEMQATGRLDHPNIVAARDAREIDGVSVLIMEYVDGMDAGELVHRLGRLNLADACMIARQTALALQYADEHGLIHRDVKPSNIMISRQGTVKLLDLGLARLRASESQDDRLTSMGQMIGTADYVSPEQVTDSASVDIRADVYSLGCTLYRLLCRRAPFDEQRGRFEKMSAHVSQPVPSIRTLVPALPDKLAALIARMVAKSPEHRPSPGEAAAELQPYCDEADLVQLVIEAERAGPQVADEPIPASSQPSPRDLKRRVPLAVTMALMLLCGGIGFALGIVITINHADGRKTTLEVEEGSQVAVDGSGNVEVTLPSTNSATDPVSNDHAALQGVWRVFWANVEGPRLPAMYVFYTDGGTPRVQLWEKGVLLGSGAYSLNEQQEPKQFDLTLDVGGKQPLHIEGIYAFVGEERLSLYYTSNPDEHSRPTRFSGEEHGEGVVLTEVQLLSKDVSKFKALQSSLGDRMAAQAGERRSKDKLKAIGLGLHNYHDSYRGLPPAFIADAGGMPVLSWRVAILPFIGEGDLYNRFRLHESWNSPHNSKLLAEMPHVFRAPGYDADSTNTPYLALVGPEAVFTGKPGKGKSGTAKGTWIREVLDGTSNTMVVVESRRDVPWTKPEDLAYDSGQPLPELGGVRSGGFQALFADGSVHLVPTNTPEGDLRAFITKDGGEPASPRRPTRDSADPFDAAPPSLETDPHVPFDATPSESNDDSSVETFPQEPVPFDTDPAATPNLGESAGDDYDRMQGVWQANLQFQPDHPPTQYVFYVASNQPRLQVWESGALKRWGSFSLDQQANPKAIDGRLPFEQPQEPFQETWLRGIYRFLGEDRIQMCFTPNPLRPVRPISFRSNPRENVHLVELRRVSQEVSEKATLLNHDLAQKTREVDPKHESYRALRTLGIAFQNYHDVHLAYPPAFLCARDGKPLLSWRVLLLPFVEHGDLFDRFHRDEPWDSPHNLKLLDKMPDLYRAPGQNPNSTNASYYALVGPSTVFTGISNQNPRVPRGTRIRDIKDGTSNTILIVQSQRDVPWTKPEDIPYAPTEPVPQLGGIYEDGFEDGFLALFADGGVSLIGRETSERDLRALFTRDGGEAITGGRR